MRSLPIFLALVAGACGEQPRDEGGCAPGIEVRVAGPDGSPLREFRGSLVDSSGVVNAISCPLDGPVEPAAAVECERARIWVPRGGGHLELESGDLRFSGDLSATGRCDDVRTVTLAPE